MAESNVKKELCTLRIMFQVNSDEDALAKKKAVTELFADVPDAEIQFMMLAGKANAPQIR